MENYSIVIFILGMMIGLSAIADKIRLPYPILLVTAGIAIGFIPNMPQIIINPEVIFLIFLPPLLYDAAFNISLHEFRNNFKMISTLAFALVFMTTAGIAVTAYYVIPGMTWPLAFALGAILSATDAVAAMSITKGLGLPHKTITILEGESLINDASGLIAYRFAVAAVAGTSFVLWKASLAFVGLILGGCIIGVALGRLLGIILKRTKDNSLVSVSLTLLMPFFAYLLAETLHVSGVIAVVTSGIMISLIMPKTIPEHTKVQSKAIWDIIIFLLNGLIFILIGLEFPYVIESIDHDDILPLIGYSFLICLVTLVIRMGRVYLQHFDLQKNFRKKNTPRNKRALLDWKNCLVIGWSGMRGIVSLATALALPHRMSDGTPFPERHTIIFISVVVVLITLVVQGMGLPVLVKALNLQKKEEGFNNSLQ